MPMLFRLSLVLFAMAGATAVFAQQHQFDGSWSVEVITEKGECDKSYRYPVTIQGSQLRYGGSESFQASGGVSPKGAVSGRIARGGDGANVRGELDGKWGQGTWTLTGAKACSGRWTAERRG